jgi:hypothetical protein
MKLKMRTLALAAVVSAALAGSALAQLPSLASAELGQGPFSSMRMLLEKTFLKIDVAWIDVRVSKRVQAELSKLAKGRAYSDALETELAKAIIDADHAVVQLTFVRDVPLDRWIDGVRESVDKAVRAKLISAELGRRVNDGLPQWFKAVAAEGFHDGDRVLYEARPGTLRTVAVTRAGRVLVERTDKDPASSRVVLASFFAPGTDYRELLLNSLVAQR